MLCLCQLHAQKEAQIQLLTVGKASCDDPPLIVCPPDFESCPGVSIHPANTGHATGLASGPLCSPPFIDYKDSVVTTNGCNGSAHIIRTWIATHAQNPALKVSCEQIIILSDTIAPIILDCPRDTTVVPNGGCFANVFWDQPLVFDDCGNLNLTVSHVSGDRFPKGTTTVTYTATDACGNVTTCSFDIHVVGDCCDLPPVIVCPGDYSGCPGDSIQPKKIGRAMAMAGRPNCDPPVVLYRDDTISMGPCKGALMIDRTWIAVDPHNPNLTARCIQRISLEDKRNPFIFGCPPNMTVDSDENCEAIVSWVKPSARDNCGGVMVESNYEPGDTFDIGTTTVIYVATDACGNTATCSFEVTVIKKCCDEDPLIDCPADFVGCPGSSTDPSVTGTAVATPGGPNCKQPMLRYEETIVSEGPCPGQKKIKRLWIAQDSVNPDLRATCIQFITLKDTIDPLLVRCTRDTTLKTNTDCRATLTWSDPVFTDNCSSVTLSSSHQPGDTFDIGMTTVIYTATDACGNTASCSFVITVLDDCCNKPPMITCPPTYITCPKKDVNPDIAGKPTVERSHPTCGTPVVTFKDDTISTGPCPNEMRIERTWTAADPDKPALNASCVQVIILSDLESPIFWECPNDTIVSPKPDCEAIVNWIPPLATDNCGLVSVTSNYEPGDTFQIGVTTVIYKAVDGCGNDTTCVFTITVKDECCKLPPTITCPPDYTGCPGSDIHPDFTGRASAVKSSAFCDDPVITFKDDTIGAGNCPNSAIIERTWTAVIPNRPNLSASCVQILTIDDKEPPVLSDCPTDISVAPNDDCEAIVLWTRPGISDNCGISSVTSSHMPGDTFQVGNTTVTYTLTDVCGLKATCSFVVTVRDECCNKPPVITCPIDFKACPRTPLDPATTGSATAVKGHLTCDDPIITSQDRIVSTGPCPGALVIERTWIATDPNDPLLADSCMQLITLDDKENPTITNCPTDTTLSPNVDCEAQVFWNNPTVSDNCGTPSITSTHNSGDLFPIGQTTVVLTATDGCGNTATCSFVITVRDDCCNKPPVIACPTDFQGCPRTPLDPATTGSATASKGHPTCDDPIISSKDRVVSTGPCPGALVIERTWIATDPNNPLLADSCMQLITLDDKENPTITNCPTDTTLSPNVDCEAQVFWNNPTVSDNCGTPTITSTHNSGDLFPIGQTTVVLTATDGCGNTATCSFVITVRDDCCNKPPVITCPTDYQGCPSSSTDPAVTGSPSVTKGHPTCDDPVVTRRDTFVTQGPCIGAAVIDRIWTATDPNNPNLSATCTQRITLVDNVDPTITNCPSDTTLSPNVDCEAQVFWNNPTVSDNCGTPSITSTHNSGDLFPIGQTTVVLTATDGCGNTATCSFVITVRDDCCNKPPVIACPTDYQGCPSSSIDPAVTGSPSVTKGHPTCDDPIVTRRDTFVTQGPCAGAAVIDRIWTATDPNNPNLSATCTQRITLKDDVDPTLNNCPGNITAQANEDCIAIVTWTPPTASDNCAGVVLSSTHSSGDTFQVGTTTVIYTATDGCGNTATCSFDVEVESTNIHIMCPGDTTISSPTFSFGEYVSFDLPDVVQCNPTCPDSLAGFIYMGERNGHRYFCSNYRSTWKEAQKICDSLGGYLAVVNDEAENNYLAGLLMGQPAYIGLNDFQTEGDFEWVNGDPLNFTSWAVGQPDDKLNYQDVGELHPDGTWEDQFQYIRNEFICEIPCVTIKQIEGSENGGFFTCGETKVTYVATDANGEADTCSFVVNVDCNNYQPYCYAKGLNSDKIWLNSISVGSFGKVTGNDGGYGDYTPTCIEVISGEKEKMCVGVGYGGLPENVFWRAWIDYNNDRDFDDLGEMVARGYGKVAMCDDIYIPDLRDTRTIMRVAISKGRAPASCGFVADGEYEDYCIFINDPTALKVLAEEEADAESLADPLHEQARQIKVYPNPAHDLITLDWQNDIPAYVKIVDLLGREFSALEGQEINSVNQIDVSSWHSGRYQIIAHYPEGDKKYVSVVITDD